MKSLIIIMLLLVQPLIAQINPPEKKSVSTGVIYSLLVPGMGEMYAGQYGTGKYFTVAEGALWLTLLAFDRQGSWLEADAHNFAAQHAQVNLNGKSEQYFVDIGNFNSVYAYNQQVLRDRDVHKLYDEQSAYKWTWDSPANRDIYRDRIVSSNQMFNNTRFVAAAIAVNHVVSAINAARLIIANNKNAEQSEIIDIHASVTGGYLHPDGIMISFKKSF